MKENTVLKKLQAGRQVVGTMMELNDTLVVESLAISGLDYFVVDSEHSSYNTETLKHIAQTAELRNATPFLRVRESTRAEILHALDIGMQGLVIPNIYSAAEVEQVITWAKYKPLGNRGFFTSRLSDFGRDGSLEDISQLMNNYNNQTMLLPQCETRESLEVIEEIVALDGVSGIFVGPFDLSIALDIPGEFEHPAFKEALDKILQACLKHQKYAFIFGGSIAMAQQLARAGFHGIACSMDINLLIEAASQMVTRVRSEMRE